MFLFACGLTRVLDRIGVFFVCCHIIPSTYAYPGPRLGMIRAVSRRKIERSREGDGLLLCRQICPWLRLIAHTYTTWVAFFVHFSFCLARRDLITRTATPPQQIRGDAGVPSYQKTIPLKKSSALPPWSFRPVEETREGGRCTQREGDAER